MRWPLSLHVGVALLLAASTACVVAGALWFVLGTPRLHVAGPLKPADVYDGIKIALAVVAGIGGVMALVVGSKTPSSPAASSISPARTSPAPP